MAKARSEIIAYHDETAQTGPDGNLCGHILYFAPRRIQLYDNNPSLFGGVETEYKPQDLLLTEISALVKEAGLSHHKFHFTTRTGTKWTRYAEAYRRLIQLGVDSLKRKDPVHVPKPTHCKMAVMFYPSGADVSIFGGEGKERYLRHDETVIRWLLKGALHRLYSEDHEVDLVGIVSDGNPNHRDLDDWRILERMEHDFGPRTSKLREYVSVNEMAQIIHLSSDPGEHDSTRKLEHCTMLQLADLLFGAVRRSYFKAISNCPSAPPVGHRLQNWKKKDVLAVPMRETLEKRKRGTGFKHSSHFGSFTVSKVDFTDAGPRFEEIQLKEKDQSYGSLFDNQ
jgi:hypothetical protein